MATDYFRQGAEVGGALQQGQDANYLRERTRVLAGQHDETYGLDTRQKVVDVGDAERASVRKKGLEEWNAAAPAYDEGATPATGLPTEGAPPVPKATKAQYLEHIAEGERRFGSAAGHLKAKDAALQAQGDEALRRGQKDFDTNPDAMAIMLNGTPGNPQKVPGNPNLSFGKVKDSKGKETNQTAITIIEPNGNGYSFMATKNDLRMISGYTAMMDVDPKRAMEGLSKIDAHLATLYDVQYKRMQTDIKENNVAGKQVGDHEVGVMNAGAAQTNASAHMLSAKSAQGLANDTLLDRKDARDRRAEAAKIMEDYDALTPEEQAGPKGLALTRKFNLTNVKAGGQVNLTPPRAAGAGASTAKEEFKLRADNAWKASEIKLMEANTDPADIQKQKDAFMVRQGIAPDAAMAALASGFDPKTKEKLTEADVTDFERHFPNTPLDRSKLAWLTPAPVVNPKPKAAGLPVPSMTPRPGARVVPGAGQARMPWEAPTGSF